MALFADRKAERRDDLTPEGGQGSTVTQSGPCSEKEKEPGQKGDHDGGGSRVNVEAVVGAPVGLQETLAHLPPVGMAGDKGLVHVHEQKGQRGHQAR